MPHASRPCVLFEGTGARSQLSAKRFQRGFARANATFWKLNFIFIRPISLCLSTKSGQVEAVASHYDAITSGGSLLGSACGVTISRFPLRIADPYAGGGDGMATRQILQEGSRWLLGWMAQCVRSVLAMNLILYCVCSSFHAFRPPPAAPRTFEHSRGAPEYATRRVFYRWLGHTVACCIPWTSFRSRPRSPCSTSGCLAVKNRKASFQPLLWQMRSVGILPAAHTSDCDFPIYAGWLVLFR